MLSLHEVIPKANRVLHGIPTLLILLLGLILRLRLIRRLRGVLRLRGVWLVLVRTPITPT